MEQTFDFENHKKDAISRYTTIRPLYKSFSDAMKSVISECINNKGIMIHSIEARAKTIESFGEKSIIPNKEDPNKPKYSDPLSEITDLSGVRIIVFFPKTLKEIDSMISDEFEVIERSDKREILEKEEKLGYQSIHFLVKMKENRNTLPEYGRYKDLVSEIQVRTILQHAWAEIEHDIQYKSVSTIPKSIKRRFMALAGLLELADKEFQSIQDEDFEIRENDIRSVNAGDFNVENINQSTLKTYLDKRFGPDGRMSEFSYSWEAEMLIKMGFKDFKEIDNYLQDLDDDNISRIIWGSRQGQLSRFEDTLMAGMKEDYLERHPWCSLHWWKEGRKQKIELLRQHGIIKDEGNAEES